MKGERRVAELKQKYNGFEFKKFKQVYSSSEIYTLKKNGDVFYLKFCDKEKITREINALNYLKTFKLCAEIIEYGDNFLITREIAGKTLREYGKNKDLFINLYKEAADILHSVDIRDCKIFAAPSCGAPGSSRPTPPLTPHAFIHGDFYPVNIIVNNNKINGFVDLWQSGIGGVNIDLDVMNLVIEKHFQL